MLETALGDPFAPSQTPYLVSPEQAQTVVDHLRTMWSQLEEAPSDGLPFMRVLLLSKKLRCIDQLRPADEEVEGQQPIPWQVLELGALLRSRRTTSYGSTCFAGPVTSSSVAHGS